MYQNDLTQLFSEMDIVFRDGGIGIAMKPVPAITVLSGDEERIRITYTNGLSWNQKNVEDWKVVEGKSGGYDIDYNFTVVEDMSTRNFTETGEGTVHHVSKGGDVAKVEVFFELNGVSASTTYNFQPVKA